MYFERDELPGWGERWEPFVEDEPWDAYMEAVGDAAIEDWIAEIMALDWYGLRESGLSPDAERPLQQAIQWLQKHLAGTW